MKDYMSEMYWKHVYHSLKTLYLQRDYGVRESGANPELCPQRYASEFSRKMSLQQLGDISDIVLDKIARCPKESSSRKL